MSGSREQRGTQCDDAPGGSFSTPVLLHHLKRNNHCPRLYARCALSRHAATDYPSVRDANDSQIVHLLRSGDL